MDAFRTNRGDTLLSLSRRAPLLVVFLRHSGCSFCREALADLRDRRERIENAGARIVLVHMTGDDDAARFFAKHDLGDVDRVSDPHKGLYRAFGLRRGTARQLFGPRVWLRGAAAALRGRLPGRPDGDPFQMPGAFLVRNGRIVCAHRHDDAGDRPDYAGMCAIGAEGVPG